MKRLFLFLLFFVFAFQLFAGERQTIKRYNTLTKSWIETPLVTIHDIQYCAPESLAIADTLPVTNTTKWSVQAAARAKTATRSDDTVTVVAIVVVPAKIITYTCLGWTMLLYDTNATTQWGGVLVRVNGSSTTGIYDTAAAQADGFLAPEAGDVIMMTGTVQEYPAGQLFSGTQFQPVPGIAITMLGKKPVPPYMRKNISDFYTGIYPSGLVKYSTGEQYEGMLVELVNLTCDFRVNLTRGTISMVDALGNQISDYDCSRYFTFGSTTDHPFGPDPVWTTHFPAQGQRVDTIRGYIQTASGMDGYRGYRISPLYYGDVVLGISLPSVTAHRRYPVAVTSLDSVRVQATVRYNQGGFGIRSAVLIKSIDNGPWIADTMSMITTDSVYQSYIFDSEANPYPAGTSVKYFIKGIDTMGNQQFLANSNSQMSTDTGKGMFFYKVIDGPMTIHDVQYTPYESGQSPYYGGQVTITGTVTADTNDMMRIRHLDLTGTNVWYMQTGNQPWNGIWVTGADSVMGSFVRGDSIQLTGYVSESGGVTQLYNLSYPATLIAHNRPLPEPIELTTNTFVTGSKIKNPEQYEGMLVKFVNTNVNAISPYYSDPKLFEVDNSGVPVFINADGKNSYSNAAADTTIGKTKILHQGDKIDTLIGIVYFSVNRWSVDPRTDADIRGVGDWYTFGPGWNMISIPKTQQPSADYSKSNLFPGITATAFYYDGTYKSTSHLDIRKGFWMKFPSTTTVRQRGATRTVDTMDVGAGWNLIGVLSVPSLTSKVSTIPGTMTLSSFFGYQTAYKIADTLFPTRGYWVKTSESGKLVLDANAVFGNNDPSIPSISEFNTITITDKDGNNQVLYFGEDTESKLELSKFEMPPAAMQASTFDARYSSGRIIEAYPRNLKEGTEFPIQINSQSSPLTVSWNITNQADKFFVLADNDNGKTLKTRELSGTGSVMLTKTGAVKLNLKIQSGSLLPKEFSLGQNYPNPFNPSTKFEVGLPKSAHLQVYVYNILGQKVATLVDEMLDAGYHSLVWNGTSQSGSPVATGIYFIRMNADKFNAVRKVMLMK